jgi:hypothetical protein
MSRRTRSSLVLVVWSMVLHSGELLACGGGYRSDGALGSDEQLLRSPRTSFLAELHHAFPKTEDRFDARSWDWLRRTEQITQYAGRVDLGAALAAAGVPRARNAGIQMGYVSVREHLRNYHQQLRVYRQRTRWMTEERRKRVEIPVLVAPEVPDGLPREFGLYLGGAIAWHMGDVKEARHQWRAVLALPVEQRKYRSVWAAYMLGRSYVGKDTDQMVKWFGSARRLAAAGFSDSTGLAAASLGWLGQVALGRGDTLAAIKLYVGQLGPSDASAAASLRICASRLLKAGGKELDRAAHNELARGVLAAHLVAGADTFWIASGETGREHVQAWLEAVEKAGVRELPGASRLGWAAYRTGLMGQAQRWADRAPKHDVIACWIRAKLSLRAGKLDRAAEQLAVALEAPAPAEHTGDDNQRQKAWFLRSLGRDLASLRLSRRQYIEALNLLLTHGHSGMYLVERVLTLDELIAYVDARPKDRRISRVRDGLARRLVRVGRWQEARGYLPLKTQKRLDDYIAAIRKGHNAKLTKAERAEAFWTAAQAARKWGRELMGYAICWYGGERDGTFYPWRELPRTSAKSGFTAAPASEDERRRVGHHRPSLPEHWHHLYEAVAHAWSACELMPDNDAKTARMLCEAGTWIKYRDPQAANPFYQALVLRCGDTELGKEAARLRWFPKIALDPKK